MTGEGVLQLLHGRRVVAHAGGEGHHQVQLGGGGLVARQQATQLPQTVQLENKGTTLSRMKLNVKLAIKKQLSRIVDRKSM